MQIDSCRLFCSIQLFKGERTEKNSPLRWICANWLKYTQNCSTVLTVLFGGLEGLSKEARHAKISCLICMGLDFQRDFNWTQLLAGTMNCGWKRVWGSNHPMAQAVTCVSTANSVCQCVFVEDKFFLSVIRPISVSNAALLWIVFICISLYFGHVKI